MYNHLFSRLRIPWGQGPHQSDLLPWHTRTVLSECTDQSSTRTRCSLSTLSSYLLGICYTRGIVLGIGNLAMLSLLWSSLCCSWGGQSINQWTYPSKLWCAKKKKQGRGVENVGVDSWFSWRLQGEPLMRWCMNKTWAMWLRLSLYLEWRVQRHWCRNVLGKLQK